MHQLHSLKISGDETQALPHTLPQCRGTDVSTSYLKTETNIIQHVKSEIAVGLVPVAYDGKKIVFRQVQHSRAR